jgi:hypothetical protein
MMIPDYTNHIHARFQGYLLHQIKDISALVFTQKG